jgi:hypothetical protein
MVCLPRSVLRAFGVWLELVAWWGPLSIQCSTARSQHGRRYLNSFRGEPAITEFA